MTDEQKPKPENWERPTLNPAELANLEVNRETVQDLGESEAEAAWGRYCGCTETDRQTPRLF
jgi:hypothetical protein